MPEEKHILNKIDKESLDPSIAVTPAKPAKPVPPQPTTLIDPSQDGVPLSLDPSCVVEPPPVIKPQSPKEIPPAEPPRKEE